MAERRRNVLLDAGAGTGKTTILIERLIRLLAPTDDAPPIPIRRIAAVTFTRRAAGELRLRLRERLLTELARRDLPDRRRGFLRDALDGLDAAYVGTIHSFADRLLRQHTVEAGLSPSYEIVEDAGELVRETLDDLLHGVQTGSLAEMLRGTGLEARAAEACAAVRNALAAGVGAGSRAFRWRTARGLEDLVADFANRRDVPPREPEPRAFDRRAFQTAVDEFVGLVAALPAEPAPEGIVWLRTAADLLREHRDTGDPAATYREIFWPLTHAPNDGRPRKSVEFAGNPEGYEVWKAFQGSRTGEGKGAPALRDEILRPFREWLAFGLVRAWPVIVALYERVKARRRVLDQLDLLIRLRDLLRDDPDGVRAESQRRFDHLLIDEFQDTDPLQAEIVAFLCENGATARRWDDARLATGRLTIVGDPKQSIYRFRRADVAMYDEVRRRVLAGRPLVAPLVANFRSRPSLIAFFNDRFESLLGRDPGGAPFDANTGHVFHQRLEAGRRGATEEPRVHVVPLRTAAERPKAAVWRRLEARALAAYLRWLVDVERSRTTVTDEATRRERAVRFGDIAVLAISTSNLPLLFAELDRAHVPWTARGARLFLQDPLHRRFLLALRALADPADGAAEAALLRPPFFALDPADHLAATARGEEASEEPVRRRRAARELVAELRRRRFERSPGATARDLLERTGLARAVALSANGPQRLERLRELCSRLERLATDERLDFDAVSARLRAWVEDPVPLDPPSPVGADVVQVMTVHQAKGLEFPVVVLWDCRAPLADRQSSDPAWAVSRDGRRWMLSLERVECDSGENFLARERTYRDAERLRLVYVAATRARDLLVLPVASEGDDGSLEANEKLVTGRLVRGAPPSTLRILEVYREDAGAAWAAEPPPAAVPRLAADEQGQDALAARWAQAAAEAAAPRFRPCSVSRSAHEPPLPWPEEETESPAETAGPSRREDRHGRFGAVFGDTVHRAIRRLVEERSTDAARAAEAVRWAALRTGLTDRLREAAEDAARAAAALKRAGLFPTPGVDVRLEYPVAGAGPAATLLAGFVDLLAADAERLTVVDFKTDPPIEGSPETAYPAYVAQLRSYLDLLAPLARSLGKPLRAFLLFTASGRLVEVPRGPAGVAEPPPDGGCTKGCARRRATGVARR